MDTAKRIYYAILGTVLLVFTLWIRGCFTDKALPVSFNAPLHEDTLAQISVEDHHIAIRTHKETKAAYVPDTGHVSATITHSGDLYFDVQDKGFTLRPVLGILLSDKLRVGVGAEVGYWNRFELYVGGGFPAPVAFVGLGYRLDQLRYLQNTSLAVVYDSKKQIGLSVLVRF